jgi:TonB family protein
MKKTLLIIFLSVFFLSLKAQINNTDTTSQTKVIISAPNPDTKNASNTEPAFIAVEKEPSFPGGIDRFYSYLQYNLVYPADAFKKRIEGKVFVNFVVEKDGALTNITILRGVSPDIDTEALRVVSSSPKWKPGMQNGRVIRVRYAMGITFKLPKQELTAQQRIDSLRNLPSDQKIFTAVEHAPQFPGGIENFYGYLKQNLRYPDKARDQKISGKVWINFVIEKDGSLTDIQIWRSLSPETDAEAIRVMQNCPRWNPGMQNGRPVRVEYGLPITFPISSNN